MNKRLKILLTKLNEQPNKELRITPDSKLPKGFNNQLEFELALDYLEQNNYLKRKYVKGILYSISLTYQGVNWKEFRRYQFCRYIENHWIDFVAVIISFYAVFKTTQ